MKRSILVTGGAGFVGSNLAVSLKTHYPNTEVVSLDNLKRRGSELNLPRLKRHGVRFIHGDIRNKEDLDLSGLRPDTLIECSAEPSVLAGINSSPDYLVNTNLSGTVNCLEAARRWGSDFIFLSTSRVYPIEKLNSLEFTETETRFELTGDQKITGACADGISTEFPLDGFRSLYGATKLCSELLLEEYRAIYGLRCVVNRCGVVAGPWQMGKVDQGVFVHWVGSHYFKKELKYFGYNGSGKQVRDLLHIDDLYSLIDWEVNNIDKVNGRVFNVGGGRAVSLSLLETTMACGEITGNRVEVAGVKKGREADVRVYISDSSEVKRIAGWRPSKGPIDILNDIFLWIRANEKDLRAVLSV